MDKTQTIKFHTFKEGRDMLTRIIKSLSKESIKRLCAIMIISFALLMLIAIAYLSNFISLIVALLLTVLFAMILAISFLALILAKTQNDWKVEVQQELEKLKEELSDEEFTEVQFVPDLTKFTGGTRYAYEDRNLVRCLRIFEDFRVTHFAKIGDNDNIIVIAKDAAGNPSMPEIMNPRFFNANYKVLK